MMHAFIAGELVRDPGRRTAKNGNDYATGLVRAGEDAPLSVSGRRMLSASVAALHKPAGE